MPPRRNFWYVRMPPGGSRCQPDLTCLRQGGFLIVLAWLGRLIRVRFLWALLSNNFDYILHDLLGSLPRQLPPSA